MRNSAALGDQPGWYSALNGMSIAAEEWKSLLTSYPLSEVEVLEREARAQLLILFAELRSRTPLRGLPARGQEEPVFMPPRLLDHWRIGQEIGQKWPKFSTPKIAN